MARRLRGRLTPLDVNRAKTRGLHSDGGGLNLQIAKGGSKKLRLSLSLQRSHPRHGTWFFTRCHIERGA